MGGPAPVAGSSTTTRNPPEVSSSTEERETSARSSDFGFITTRLILVPEAYPPALVGEPQLPGFARSVERRHRNEPVQDCGAGPHEVPARERIAAKVFRGVSLGVPRHVHLQIPDLPRGDPQVDRGGGKNDGPGRINHRAVGDRRPALELRLRHVLHGHGAFDALLPKGGQAACAGAGSRSREAGRRRDYEGCVLHGFNTTSDTRRSLWTSKSVGAGLAA